jgi:hypothetical protein
VLRTLTEQIRRLTRAEFHSPELNAAGVDLTRVRHHLTDRVDDALLEYAGAALMRVTPILLGGLVLVSVVVSVLIRQFPF